MADAVCNIGLGRIGLPVALTMASRGMSVIGLDTNDKLLRGLERGQVSIHESGPPKVRVRTERGCERSFVICVHFLRFHKIHG